MPKKERVGQVVSDKMDKTAVVKVPEYTPHPKYQKIIETNKNYKAHDPQNICAEGDTVKIQEAAPTGKGKCWRVVEVLEKAK